MMKSQQSFSVLIIKFVSCAFISISIACSADVDSHEPSPVSVWDIPSTPQNINEWKPGQTLSFRGITPGVSSNADVISLWGQPNVTRNYVTYKSHHYFNVTAKIYVVVKDELVLSISSNLIPGWAGPSGDPIGSVEDLNRSFPNAIHKTPYFYILPEYGLVFSSSIIGNWQIVVPQNLEDFTAFWGESHIPGMDPFPYISHPIEVVVQPGRTSKEQVAQLLGNPDRIFIEQERQPWLYEAIQGKGGPVNIYFDNDDIVSLINIGPFATQYIPTVTPLLDTIIGEYGYPDIAYTEESHIYFAHGLAIAYLVEGVGYSLGGCFSQECDQSIANERFVFHEWYFSPMSLTEYQEFFQIPNSLLIEVSDLLK